MSIRNLDRLFDPTSVAVIGASTRPASVGATVWRNLREGGFAGPRWAVNPKHAQIDGEAAFARVADLPGVPDLAVICTPPATVATLIAELAAKGTRAVIVLTAGFTREQKQAMLDAARPACLRLLGPNGLGLLSPAIGLNASFAHASVAAGSLAFVSQSGALVSAMLDWGRTRGIGFSRFVSLGEQADIDFGDALDWLASDARTRAVLLYMESVQSARKFMSAARAAARNKPVIVVKAGRSAAGQQAAASHTGALAGSDVVIDAAIRRAGMLRVDTLDELFVAAEALAHVGPALLRLDAPNGGVPHDRVTLVTNGGGAGVLAADEVARRSLDLAALPDDVITALDAVLPPNWSRANPVDIIGDAPVDRYVHALEQLLAVPATGTVLFMHAPTAIVPSDAIAQALLPIAQRHPARLVSGWLGGDAVAAARRRFREAGVPTYDTPEQAVRALDMLATYRRNQALLLEAPAIHADAVEPAVIAAAAVAPAAERAGAITPGAPAAGITTITPGAPAAGITTITPGAPATGITTIAPGAQAAGAINLPAVRAIVDAALAQGRELLDEPQAKALLAACGVPTVATRIVDADATAAQQAARELGYPVVLKILSPQISHKSDVGGVALDLRDDAALGRAVDTMRARVAAERPDAQIAGFTVQPMVKRPRALELIAGTHVDAVFGPVILFGSGGTSVEVVADRAVALPPLNAPLARALIARTRIARLLHGWRDVPAVDMAAVERVLIALAQLVADEPRIAELDINPLLADAQGVIALDARVRVSASAPAGAARFAIRPYPQELVQRFDWQGRTLTLRPIRPEDEAQHRAFLESIDPADLRMRLQYTRRTIERSELARLTQIDYEREMAFIVTGCRADDDTGRRADDDTADGADGNGGDETLGVVRAFTDPDNVAAEFGILVRSNAKGAGLGRRLMRAIIDHARGRGTQRLTASVLADNAAMLGLAAKLGFQDVARDDDPGVKTIELELR